MKYPNRTFRPLASRRGQAGFTLVELLVVIVIIAILMALLIPAVMGAIRGANDAQVGSEINALGQALASFKNEYGDYPPSRIMLSESGYYPVGDTTLLTAVTWSGNQTTQLGSATAGEITVGQLAERSLRMMRKFFPRAAFTTTAPATPTLVYDFNNSLNVSPPITTPEFIYLSGDECLVFFLGGIPLNTNPNGVHGFNRLPTNPFLTQPNGNYKETFFDFKPERFQDLDGDGMLSYIDILGKPGSGVPYAYFSTNLNGNGAYDANDCNFGGILPTSESLAPTFRQFGHVRNTSNNILTSVFPNPYTTTDTISSANITTAPQYSNPQTYQIISAGRDQAYGVGGRFDRNNTSTPFPEATPALSQSRLETEGDNIVNFANGPLNN